MTRKATVHREFSTRYDRGKRESKRKEDTARGEEKREDGDVLLFYCGYANELLAELRDNEARDGHINNANLSSVTRYLSLAWQPPRHDGIPTLDRTRSDQRTILWIRYTDKMDIL